MKGAGAAAVLATLLCASPAPGGSGDASTGAVPPGRDGGGFRAPREEAAVSFRASNRHPFQGEPVFLAITISPPPDNVAVEWKGRRFPARAEGDGRFVALIGVDLLEAPGKVPVAFHAGDGGASSRAEFELEVREKTFPVQALTLPAGMATFDPATVERIRREAALLEEKFSGAPGTPAWETPFVAPVEAFRPEGFGSRRLINGEPRQPHAGVDVKLPEGTPVRAIASGTVALAAEQFLGGRSVVLDHGGGLFSVYYHLSDYSVAEGQRVGRGDRIGSVGRTGRATGAHLHFGVRAAGGRVDPAMLFPGSPGEPAGPPR